MKKISVITTGGTIGSLLNEDSVSVEMTEKRILREVSLAKDRLKCSVSISSPINKNSEDLSPLDWVTILHAIKIANDSDSTGIVITHGTDTLAYSVAVALAFANQWHKKVCFTGAFYPPNHPSSDVTINLLSSLEFASSTHPVKGVFVAFRSNLSNTKANIIDGINLKPMAFDDPLFESAYDENVATFNLKLGLSSERSSTTINSPCLDSDQIPEIEDVQLAGPKVALITLYPGIDKPMLDAAAKGRDILILQGYHCGTGPSQADCDLLNFIEQVSPTTQILIGTFPQKYIDMPYQSTLKLKAAGAHLYADLQVHFLYVFSILGLSLSMSASEIIERLKNCELK